MNKYLALTLIALASLTFVYTDEMLVTSEFNK